MIIIFRKLSTQKSEIIFGWPLILTHKEIMMKFANNICLKSECNVIILSLNLFQDELFKPLDIKRMKSLFDFMINTPSQVQANDNGIL